MLIERENGKNIISYVDFSKTCHAITCFSILNKTFGKNISFTLSPSSRTIEWQKKHLNQLYQSVFIIDTILFKDFSINKIVSGIPQFINWEVK